jgi:hypothetical protein
MTVNPTFKRRPVSASLWRVKRVAVSRNCPGHRGEPYLVDSFSRDKMKAVGISTESESRSQEVVARSGFGLYGLGWLWHLTVSIPKETR